MGPDRRRSPQDLAPLEIENRQLGRSSKRIHQKALIHVSDDIGNTKNGGYPTNELAGNDDVQREEHEGVEKFKGEETGGQPKRNTWNNFITRGLFTILMIASFVSIIAAGHQYVILMAVLIQMTVFKEVIDIAHQPWHQKKLPWFRTISWYFLLTTNYFLYGESFIHHFKKTFLLDAFLLPMASHHRFISFSLYIAGTSDGDQRVYGVTFLFPRIGHVRD